MLVGKGSRNKILEASVEMTNFEERETIFPPSALNHVSKLHPERHAQNAFQLKVCTCATVP